MTTIDLGGDDWRVREFLPGDWTRDEIAEKALAQQYGWLPARVPGSIQDDLWRAGAIADPYVARGSLAAEWVPTRTWVYARTFDADPAWHGRRPRLRFHGVDYAARFVLNGVELGAHEGMSTHAVFEIADVLRDDAPNELVVVIAPAPAEQDQMGRTSLVRSRKSRMGYWWDFCPRVINVGLWDAVTIELSGPVRIDDVRVRPRLNDGMTRAEVAVDVTLAHAPSAAGDLRLDLDLVIYDPSGEAVATARTSTRIDASGSRVVSLAATVDQPQLWWPNGQGEQPLYRAVVRAVGDVVDRPDEHETVFGIRSIEVVPNATEDATAPPYTFVVNGRVVYINGWNWVPIDALYGVPRPEKLEAVLQLASRAHVNLLRVNGVGVIERTDFYERCDRLGILVWQEFLVTSSEQDRDPADDAAYVEAVVAEAREIVPRLRNHASLAIWCAGNELEGADKLPLGEDEPLIAALHEVVRDLDPDRVWLPTSPVGRKPFNGLSSIRRDPDGLHDVHGPWLYEGLDDQYTLYNETTSLFHSEFGVEGLTNLETLEALLPSDELDVARLHSATWRHLSGWWVRPELWREWFGPIGDLRSLVWATQHLQAEGVRYAIESNRRRMPRNSGSLPWQFNEPYPMAACTSAIDYHARPKDLYHAVESAYRPLSVSARYDRLAWGGHDRFEAELWAVSALGEPVTGASLQARVVGVDGRVAARAATTVDVLPGVPVRAGTIASALGDLSTDAFVLDLMLRDAAGTEIADGRVVFSRTADLRPLVALPETDVSATIDGAAQQVRVVNEGDVAALSVRATDARDVRAGGHALADAGGFCLLPGEAREIGIDWIGVAPADRAVRVEGWNVAVREGKRES